MESQVESQTVPTCDAKSTRKNMKIRILVTIVAVVLLIAASVVTYKMTMGSQTASSKAATVVQSNQKQDTGNKDDVTGTSFVVDKSRENPSNGSDNGGTQPSNNGTTSGSATPNKERIYFSPLYQINWGKICSVAADGTDYKCHAENLSSKLMYVRAVSKADPATVIYSTNNKLFSLNLLDNTGKILDDGNSKYYARFSPDQKYLAYVNDNNHILKVIKTESGEEVYTKDLSKHAYIKDMTFTPDGKHIFILTGDNNDIMKINAADGSDLTKVATIGSGYAGGALCPDGKTFVGIKGHREIFVSRYENGTVTQLYDNNDFKKGIAEIISWSQDNTKAYISLYISGGMHLYEYSMAENALKQIKNEKDEPVSLA